MDLQYIDNLSTGGFNFENCIRNKALFDNGIMKEKAPMKTGTTIVGLVFKVSPTNLTPSLPQDGVILAADTRATGGSIVGDKNCMKIHDLASNIKCCGAGTAADCDHVTGKIFSKFIFIEMLRRELELQKLNTGRENRVYAVVQRLTQHLFRYQGHIGTGLIIGGVDCQGYHLGSVSPDGATSYNPYMTTGSGSLAAMAIFESEYRENLTVSLDLFMGG